MDNNVSRVLAKYVRREAEGYKKYGVTTERNDVDLVGWLTHLQEELMDATIYLERIKNEMSPKAALPPLYNRRADDRPSGYPPVTPIKE